MKILRSLKKRKLGTQSLILKFMLLVSKSYLEFNNKKINLSWEKHQRKINKTLSDIKINSISLSEVNFTLNNDIPKLAWCLKIAESGINVNYGPGVIRHSKGIVEGVWDEEFSDFDYAKSEHVFGSGLTVGHKKIIITPPSHMYECVIFNKK